MNPFRRIKPAFAAAAVLSVACTTADATPYFQTNLVSDVPGLAQITDPALQNPWGMSFSATSPFWISNQGTNTSTLYRVTNGAVAKQALTVSIPTTGTGPQGPTGQVFNSAGAGSFVLPNGAAANFIFSNLNGTISAWNGAAGTTAVIEAATAGAVYTGLALGTSASGPRLYAADAAGGKVDVFNASFQQLGPSFVNNDPRLAGLAPFNVEVFGNRVYVTYAPLGRAAQIVASEGQGAVAVFDTDGNLIQTLITGSKLASPWGLAIAPADFGDFSNTLLVGNFSFAVSEINAFDLVTGALRGTITDFRGNPLINSGLWDIAFGNGVTGAANVLYFNAGINGEANGLFGSIAVVPEPAPLVLLGIGIVAWASSRRRRVVPQVG